MARCKIERIDNVTKVTIPSAMYEPATYVYIFNTWYKVYTGSLIRADRDVTAMLDDIISCQQD